MHCAASVLQLPEQVAEHLASAFRERCPRGRIVVLSSRAMEKPDFADTLLYKIDGPEALIDAISDLAIP